MECKRLIVTLFNTLSAFVHIHFNGMEENLYLRIKKRSCSLLIVISSNLSRNLILRFLSFSSIFCKGPRVEAHCVGHGIIFLLPIPIQGKQKQAEESPANCPPHP